MTIRNLDALFEPKSIALIGASNQPRSVGAVLARNLFEAGFDGPILTVNPHEQAIRSALNYRSVAELPATPDLAVIATPPAAIPGLIAELGARGCRAAVVVTAGFGEGERAEGEQLRQKMLEAARPAPPAHRRAQLPRLHLARPRHQCELRPPDAAGRRPRLRHPVRRDRHRPSRLGRGARLRLLARRLARRHGRRRFRRPPRLPRPRSRHARDPPLRREHHARAQVHVGRPDRGARQAGDRHQVRPERRRRQGGPLPHRRARRLGSRLRRRLPPRRHAARQRAARAVRGGDDALRRGCAPMATGSPS